MDGRSDRMPLNSIRARQNKSSILEDLQENMILSRTQFKTQRQEGKKRGGVVVRFLARKHPSRNGKIFEISVYCFCRLR
jgi:ketosteroid isomerase-like protein